MSFVDDPNKNSSNAQVAGSTPLSQGGSAPMSDQGQSAPSSDNGSSVIQTGADVNAAGSQGNTTNKSGKASSGMFTNIQKYVNKNKPQAQKMSSAATQDFSKQAESIRNATQQKKQEQQTAINAGTGTMNAQKEQARNIVQGVTGGNTDVSQEQIQQYQGFLQGPNVADVNDLNLAQEQNKVQALQNMAGQVETDQGRQNLLKETFGDRAYSRGQSSLDNLIMSGDKTAREGLIQGVQGQADQTNQALNQAAQESQQNLGNYRQQKSSFADNISNIGNTALTDADADIEAKYQAELTARQNLLNPESAEYQAALTGAQGKLDSIGNNLSSKSAYTDYLMSLNPGKYSGLSNYNDMSDELAKTGGLTVNAKKNQGGGGYSYYTHPVTGERINSKTVTLTGADAQKEIDTSIWNSMNHYKNRKDLRNVYSQVNQNFVGNDEQDLYGLKDYDYGQNTARTSWNDKKNLGYGVDRSFADFSKQLKGLGSAENIVQGRLGRLTEGDYEKLAQGGDIGRYETEAGKENVSKINALKQLMGQEDLITEEQMGDGKYADMEEIMKLIKGYSGE